MEVHGAARSVPRPPRGRFRSSVPSSYQFRTCFSSGSLNPVRGQPRDQPHTGSDGAGLARRESSTTTFSIVTSSSAPTSNSRYVFPIAPCSCRASALHIFGTIALDARQRLRDEDARLFSQAPEDNSCSRASALVSTRVEVISGHAIARNLLGGIAPSRAERSPAQATRPDSRDDCRSRGRPGAGSPSRRCAAA